MSDSPTPLAMAGKGANVASDTTNGGHVNLMHPLSWTQESEEYAREIQLFKDRVHSLKSLQGKANAEEIACMKELAEKKKHLKELSGSIANVTDIDEKKDSKIKLMNAKKELEALENLFPRKPHVMLQWSLGSANFSLPEATKLRYKTEYESFKLAFTGLNFVISLLNLFVIHVAWVDMLHYFFLLYTYSTITLREHILQVNGSRIRTWWLFHHYLSIALTGTLLIWPAGPTLAAFRTQFLAFNLYISGVQYLQYRYQMSRLYTLRALSKIGPMDVTTDSAQVHVRNNLTFLLPFLIVGQCFQFYNAYTLFEIWQDPVTQQWQVLTCAILFILLGIGNISTTLLTFYQKVKRTTQKDHQL